MKPVLRRMDAATYVKGIGRPLIKIALCSQRLPVRHGIREPRACSEAY
jgi:hypothetical protein